MQKRLRAFGAAVLVVAFWGGVYAFIHDPGDKARASALIAGFLVICACALIHVVYTFAVKR